MLIMIFLMLNDMNMDEQQTDGLKFRYPIAGSEKLPGVLRQSYVSLIQSLTRNRGGPKAVVESEFREVLEALGPLEQ